MFYSVARTAHTGVITLHHSHRPPISVSPDVFSKKSFQFFGSSPLQKTQSSLQFKIAVKINQHFKIKTCHHHYLHCLCIWVWSQHQHSQSGGDVVQRRPQRKTSIDVRCVEFILTCLNEMSSSYCTHIRMDYHFSLSTQLFTQTLIFKTIVQPYYLYT